MFCEATGYPRPTIAWFFNGALVTVNENVTIDTVVSPLENSTLGLGRVTSYLRLSVTHPSDAGVYECVSSNLLGSDTDRTNLTVLCECVHMNTGAPAIPQVKSGQQQCRIATDIISVTTKYGYLTVLTFEITHVQHLYREHT